MAIIYTYPGGPSPLQGDELIVISDVNNGNATRNTTAQAIADLNDFEITLDASSTGLSFDDTLKPGFYTVNLSGIVNIASGGTNLNTVGSANQVLTSNGSDLFYQTGIDGPVLFDAKASEVLVKGDVVYIDGFDVGANLATVSKADASDPTKMPAYGLALQDAPGGNEEIKVVTFGDITGLNTSSFSAGAELYVDTTPGALTDFPPPTEANLIQNIGKVERSAGGTNGTIKVGGAGRTNATPNLNEGSIFVGNSLNRSSILAISTTPGDVLTSNGATASWSAIPIQPAEDLATTLAAGNTTGGNNISVDLGDAIVFTNLGLQGEIGIANLTANRTYALPNQSGLIPAPGYPGAAQDGYVVTWNNTASEYQLLAAPLTIDLATTLAAGNTTGGTDIEMTTSDDIVAIASDPAKTVHVDFGVLSTARRVQITTDNKGFLTPWMTIDNSSFSLNYGSTSSLVVNNNSIDVETGFFRVKNNNYGRFAPAPLTADRVYTFQDKTGVVPVGPNWDSLIANPGSGENGYVISWNNGNNEYELVPQAGSGGGIYSGSGSLPVAANVVTMPSGSSLAFDGVGIGDLFSLGKTAGNDSAGFGGESTDSKLKVETTNSNHTNALQVAQIQTNTFNYGIKSNVTGAGTNNVGLQVSSTNATNNYAIITTGGQSGFGTSTPTAGAAVDIKSSTQGLLLPRWNNTEQNNNTAAWGITQRGMTWFNIDTSQFMGWNGSASVILG
jgi:hypothetical protein